MRGLRQLIVHPDNVLNNADSLPRGIFSMRLITTLSDFLNTLVRDGLFFSATRNLNSELHRKTFVAFPSFPD